MKMMQMYIIYNFQVKESLKVSLSKMFKKTPEDFKIFLESFLRQKMQKRVEIIKEIALK
jgi:hypothetical protein